MPETIMEQRTSGSDVPDAAQVVTMAQAQADAGGFAGAGGGTPEAVQAAVGHWTAGDDPLTRQLEEAVAREEGELAAGYRQSVGDVEAQFGERRQRLEDRRQDKMDAVYHHGRAALASYSDEWGAAKGERDELVSAEMGDIHRATDGVESATTSVERAKALLTFGEQRALAAEEGGKADAERVELAAAQKAVALTSRMVTDSVDVERRAREAAARAASPEEAQRLLAQGRQRAAQVRGSLQRQAAAIRAQGKMAAGRIMMKAAGRASEIRGLARDRALAFRGKASIERQGLRRKEREHEGAIGDAGDEAFSQRGRPPLQNLRDTVGDADAGIDAKTTNTQRMQELDAEKQDALDRLKREYESRLASVREQAEQARRELARGGKGGAARRLRRRLGTMDKASLWSADRQEEIEDEADRDGKRLEKAEARAIDQRAEGYYQEIDASLERARGWIAEGAEPARAAIANLGEVELRKMLGEVGVAQGRINTSLREQTALLGLQAAYVGARDLGAGSEIAALEAMARGMDKGLQVELARSAVADAEAKLGGFADGEDAEVALGTIAALPDGAQAEVIDRLGPDAFNRLLADLPRGRRVELQALYQNAKDGPRKVLLWKEAHKAKARRDVEDKNAERSDDAFQDLNRLATLGDTDREVDLEALDLVTGVGPEKLAQVAARKDTELGIEMAHAVNLTSEERFAGDGNTSRWSEPELALVGGTLERLPAEHLQTLRHIRREDVYVEDGEADANVGGIYDPADRSIHIYDTGNNGLYRHTGDTSTLSGHTAGGPTGHGGLEPLEEVLAHEVGHHVYHMHPELADWWRSVSGHDDEAPVYPSSGAHSPDNSTAGSWVDSWSYASQAAAGKDLPNEHFAEVYVKAAEVPGLLHADMVNGPDRADAAKDLHLRAQREFMRNLVYRTSDVDVDARAEEMLARVPPGQRAAAAAKLEEFKRKASVAMTPYQLEMLEDGYARSIGAR